MAVTILTQRRLTPTTVRLTYSSSLGAGTTFYIWRDGELLTSTTETFYDFRIGLSDIAQIEILDTSADASDTYPAFMQLQWEHETGATQYRVQRYVDAAWSTVALILATAEKQIYTYKTPVLADATEHQYRVAPIDAAGNVGLYATFTFTMVRKPDKADVTVTRNDATGQIIVGYGA